MIKNFAYLAFILFFSISVNAQDVVGKWENRNEEGTVNSIIEIYREGDKIYGKVDKIMKEEDREKICTNCEGKLKDQPIEGMVLMQGLEKEGDIYEGGTIVDPKTGKEYRCKIWIDEENPDVLKIRGYLAFFYRTKTWQRAE
ncbi:DUF2147 domain-containing protein [Gramella sp. AN32]|uniref:DUF2147 domain-containing protein n=1 Tax=Christiangramia antarctica TaxID=2058158 RepID=A0ABW5X9T9_9FLAO|nr:DUF2147 domain-containing protein [Gramella sp. AN32]MCM4156485.1 DUF2147 domain-containing protein [Gramella sp. AN32]